MDRVINNLGEVKEMLKGKNIYCFSCAKLISLQLAISHGNIYFDFTKKRFFCLRCANYIYQNQGKLLTKLKSCFVCQNPFLDYKRDYDYCENCTQQGSRYLFIRQIIPQIISQPEQKIFYFRDEQKNLLFCQGCSKPVSTQKQEGEFLESILPNIIGKLPEKSDSVQLRTDIGKDRKNEHIRDCWIDSQARIPTYFCRFCVPSKYDPQYQRFLYYFQEPTSHIFLRNEKWQKNQADYSHIKNENN